VRPSDLGAVAMVIPLRALEAIVSSTRTQSSTSVA
jgi:hypothetical protein